MTAEKVQTVLDMFDELVKQIKTKDNCNNLWTANSAVIPVMMLIIYISGMIGKKYP